MYSFTPLLHAPLSPLFLRKQDDCTVDLKNTNLPMTAKWVNVPSPSQARPFSTVYTGGDTTTYAATLVAMPTGTGQGVVILRATDRSAECLLDCSADCQSKCT